MLTHLNLRNKTMLFNRLAVYLIILAVIFMPLGQVFASGNDSLEIYKINDGPYMFWQNDSTLEIQYVVSGELKTQIMTGNDIINFSGLAFDSSSFYSIPVSRPEVEPFIYSEVEKIYAFSDPHGEYESLVELLIQSEIIDTELNWKFGNGHLVVNGDVFDRGDKVNEILWLIYKLEQQAEEAGGKVHFILGNHEAMPLLKDLRYINDKYTEGICKVTGKSYDQLYDSTSVIGRWLRTKNAVEKINNIIFVHAGLNPELMKYRMTSETINKIIRQNLDTPYEDIKARDTLSLLFRGRGPLWYRGFHYDMDDFKQATPEQVDSLLDYFEADHFVVGHTVLDSIGVLYNGRVFGINQDYEIIDEFKGLLWLIGRFYSIDIKGDHKLIYPPAGSKK